MDNPNQIKLKRAKSNTNNRIDTAANIESNAQTEKNMEREMRLMNRRESPREKFLRYTAG